MPRTNVHLHICAFFAFFLVFSAISCKPKPPPPPTLAPTVLPSLCLTKTDARTTKVDWPRAFSYIFTNLDPAGRAELNDVLTGYGARLEAHLNPLLEDLFDGEPKDDITRWARRHGPLVQTSISLAATEVALDATRAVTLALDPPADAGCLPIWGGPNESADLRQARFAAWPYAASFVVRVADPAKRGCLRAELRARVSEGTTFGVVIDGAEPAAMTIEEKALTDRVLMLEAMSQKDKSTNGSSRSQMTQGSTDPVLRLAPSDLLVVPRLLRINDLPALRAELDKAKTSCGAPLDGFAAESFP